MERDIKDIPIEKQGRPNKIYEELKPPAKVALRILEYNDIKAQDVNFSILCKDLEGKISRVSIHDALDTLIDQGSLHSGWQKNERKHWIRGYHIAGEEQKRQLRGLYRATHDV